MPDLPYTDILDDETVAFPRHVIVREIDFEIRENELWFFFSKWSLDKDLNTTTNSASLAALEAVIDDIIEGGYKFDYEKPSIPKPKYSSPLSLMNGRSSWIVYVLSNKNWQYVRRGRPITMGASVPGGKYLNARRVPGSGFADRNPGTAFDSPPPWIDGHKVAYFMANGQASNYSDSINLHVDLVYDGPKKRYLPIMIDPDIRWPGGSQP